MSDLFSDAAERELAARKIYYLSGSLPNVGAVARIRVTAEDLGSGRGMAAGK